MTVLACRRASEVEVDLIVIIIDLVVHIGVDHSRRGVGNMLFLVLIVTGLGVVLSIFVGLSGRGRCGGLLCWCNRFDLGRGGTVIAVVAKVRSSQQ